MTQTMQSPIEINLDGDLNVKTVRDFKRFLQENIDQHKHISLVLNADADVDVSLVQLLISAKQYSEKTGGSVHLKEPASGPLKDVLHRGGFVEAAVADDHKFWFHQEAL